jgi:hypothetical protein
MYAIRLVGDGPLGATSTSFSSQDGPPSTWGAR